VSHIFTSLWFISWSTSMFYSTSSVHLFILLRIRNVFSWSNKTLLFTIFWILFRQFCKFSMVCCNFGYVLLLL
jgi:hypothetical protein